MRVFKDAIEDCFISRNSMRKVKAPVTRKPEKDVLKAEQARLFFSNH
jgi:hypothetical protein